MLLQHEIPKTKQKLISRNMLSSSSLHFFYFLFFYFFNAFRERKYKENETMVALEKQKHLPRMQYFPGFPDCVMWWKTLMNFDKEAEKISTCLLLFPSTQGVWSAQPTSFQSSSKWTRRPVRVSCKVESWWTQDWTRDTRWVAKRQPLNARSSYC